MGWRNFRWGGGLFAVLWMKIFDSPAGKSLTWWIGVFVGILAIWCGVFVVTLW
jgi:hypothetical protein